MPLFNINNKKLESIKKVPFSLEKDMQKLTEDNLETIFKLEFVTTEFQLNNLRIDTLAYDVESNAFVIIEYKKVRNFSVIDQGYAYLALLLNNKADFILEYNEKMDKILKKNDIDWSQSRVIFIAPSFTTHQKGAIEFQDIPMELWEISKYDNGTILYNQLKSTDTNESINTISNTNSDIGEVSKEVKAYTEKKSLKGGSRKTRKFYFEIKKIILELNEDFEINYRKFYVSFVNKNSKESFISLSTGKSYMDIVLNVNFEKIEDPFNIVDDVSKIGKYGVGDCRIKMRDNKDIDKIEYIIKEAYKIYSK